MGTCQPDGFPAYNPADLAPEGFIVSPFEREYPPGNTPPQSRLDNPLLGQSFFVREDGSVVETRKVLPASGIFYELQYRTTVKSNNESLGEGGGFLGLGVLGGLAQGIASQTILGGVSVGITHFTLHQLDSSTEHDVAITINAEHLATKVTETVGEEEVEFITIEVDGFPLSVLAVTDEPLNLTSSQRSQVGAGDRDQGIAGTIEASGQFDGNIIDEIFATYSISGLEATGLTRQEAEELVASNTDLDIEDIVIEEESKSASREQFQEVNRFSNIERDPRLLRFRADSGTVTSADSFISVPGQEAAQEFIEEGAKGTVLIQGSGLKYGFSIENPTNFNDVTSNRIKIRATDLEVGSVVHLTASIATDRRLRQNIETRGTIFEGANRVGITLSEIVAIPESDVWNYQIGEWRVPKDFDEEKVDVVSAFVTGDEEAAGDLVTGWRQSELITLRQKEFFAADERGIFIFPSEEVLIAKEDIRDQEWFNKYLVDNNLVGTTFRNIFGRGSGGSRIDTPGLMFDLSPVVNSAFFDQEKFPYHRPLAEALGTVSKFDPNIPTSGVGIENLDFVRLGVEAPDGQDLSSAIFVSANQQSVFPSAYSGETCSSQGDFGSFRDPNDPGFGFQLLIPAPAPGVQTDWNITSPFFFNSYTRNSRLFVERYAPDLSDRTTRKFSMLFISALPGTQSSLSLDQTADREETFVFFESDESPSIAYHRLEDSKIREQFLKLALFESGNHEAPEFSHEDHNIVGYNFVVGDSPAYSEGSFPSNEFLFICDGTLVRDEFFSTQEEFPEDSNIIEIEIGPNDKVRDIIINYFVNGDTLLNRLNLGPIESVSDRAAWLKTFYKGIENIDNKISFSFGEGDLVINNAFIPIPIPSVESNIVSFSVDGQYYGGSPLKIQCNAFSDILSVASVEIISVQNDKLTPYRINGTQTATAIDANNRIFVFYQDPDSDNISVASSVLGSVGKKWFVNTDIIRLLQGETASFPYVITDKESNLIHLFYILNGSFLMLKTIDPNWITCEDQGVEYVPPDSFTEEDAPNKALEQYSLEGRALRKAPSYFVMGDAQDSLFTREIEITEQRVELAGQSGNSPVIRFAFRGDIEQMNAGFNNGSYAAYRDGRGTYRVLFTLSDGRLWIRRSSNLQEWFFDCQRAIAHKDFEDDTADADDVTISNPQVVYDSLANTLYFLYFHRGGLYLRVFNNNSLYPGATDLTQEVSGESDSVFVSEEIRSVIELDSTKTSLPFFLVGDMPEEVINALELPPDEENPLLIRNMYPEAIQTQFQGGDFAVDDGAKPAGYASKRGFIRIMYRTSKAEVRGLTFNTTKPTLDVQLRIPGAQS